MVEKPKRTLVEVPKWLQDELAADYDKQHNSKQKPCTNCGHTGGGGFKWNGISNEPCPSCNHQGRI